MAAFRYPLLLLAALAAASALQVPLSAHRPLGRPAPSSVRSVPHPILQEGKEETVLSDEAIKGAAAAASGGETSWPQAQPKGPTPDDTSVGPSEGFDPRIIIYVSLPALVLLGQLFFTFSRDALGDVALGPAVRSQAPPAHEAPSRLAIPVRLSRLCALSPATGHGSVHSILI